MTRPDSNGGTESDVTRRIGFALIHAREAARWDSSKATTRDDAMRYHAGLCLVIGVLEGYFDQFLGIEDAE